jgi:uncharacterized membrane protein
MFQLVRGVSGGVLWANLGLLFALSLFPVSTAWMDESSFDNLPVAMYGINLLLAAIAYWVLQTVIIRQQGAGSPLKRAVGNDLKGRTSPAFYVAGILCAWLFGRVGAFLALGFFATVSIIWVVPDRRIEGAVRDHQSTGED